MIRPVKPVLMCLCVVLLWPLAAAAHAHLQQAFPAEGSVVNTAPAQFMLKFSEAAQLTALSVQKQGEPQAQKIQPLPTAASAQISVAAPKLEPGVYELRYRVVSADSHVVSGSVHFTIATQ
jgi:methionine-rich copper-binding protein CopC